VELFSIACSTCRARLKVADPAAIGHILACPKCGSMVQVIPPPDWKPLAKVPVPVPNAAHVFESGPPVVDGESPEGVAAGDLAAAEPARSGMSLTTHLALWGSVVAGIVLVGAVVSMTLSRARPTASRPSQEIAQAPTGDIVEDAPIPTEPAATTEPDLKTWTTDSATTSPTPDVSEPAQNAEVAVEPKPPAEPVPKEQTAVGEQGAEGEPKATTPPEAAPAVAAVPTLKPPQSSPLEAKLGGRIPAIEFSQLPLTDLVELLKVSRPTNA
jgi:hypothetical protein